MGKDKKCHEKTRKALGVLYDPDEARWCVSAEMNGKTEWVETASLRHALAIMDDLIGNGYKPSIDRLSRAEIRRRFGEEDFVMYAEKKTDEHLFTVLDTGSPSKPRILRPKKRDRRKGRKD